MDHYRYPRNKRPLPDAHFSVLLENVHCGDRVSFAGRVSQDNVITALVFEGTGCVLSQAIASLMTEKFVGMTLDACLGHEDASYIYSLVDRSLGPTRFKCALLPLQALRQALMQYKKGK